MRGKKNRESNNTILAGIAIGFLTSIAVVLLGALLLTWLLLGEKVQETAIGYGVMVITIISSLAGSGVAVSYVGQHILPVSIGASIAGYLFLLAMNALFFNGQYHGVWITALLVIGSGLCVALVATNGKGRRIKHSGKMANR